MKKILETLSTSEKKPLSSENERKTSIIPRPLKPTSYALKNQAHIRDLGISSLSIFSCKKTVNRNKVKFEIETLLKKLKNSNEAALSACIDNLEEKYQVSISFKYPVMNPLKTNVAMINTMQTRITKITQQFHRYQQGVQNRLKKSKNAVKNRAIRLQMEAQHEKVLDEVGICTDIINNCKWMVNILKKISMPNRLIVFMEEINQLSIEEKKALFRLTTNKTRLSAKNNRTQSACELMFAYQKNSDDIVVGLRSNYDSYHPHPTLMGGISPSVIVAGTIDLSLDKDALKIAVIRPDSGHYMPDNEALEYMGRYIKQCLNPIYYDTVEFLHS